MAIPDPIAAETAQKIIAAVTALPGVAGVSPGRFGEVALLYPRQRIHGLRLHDEHTLEIHIVVDLNHDANLHHIARAVAQQVHELSDLTVDVFISDAIS